jgi:hypothetical protein
MIAIARSREETLTATVRFSMAEAQQVVVAAAFRKRFNICNVVMMKSAQMPQLGCIQISLVGLQLGVAVAPQDKWHSSRKSTPS